MVTWFACKMIHDVTDSFGVTAVQVSAPSNFFYTMLMTFKTQTVTNKLTNTVNRKYNWCSLNQGVVDECIRIAFVTNYRHRHRFIASETHKFLSFKSNVRC